MEILCFTLLTFTTLLVAQGAHSGIEREEEYTFDDGCPFAVLSNGTHAKPVGCRHDCNGNIETLENGIECYAIPLDVAKRMTPRLRYDCWLGKCANGVCLPNGRKEYCSKGEKRTPKYIF
ncbi:hypothetical protein V5799_011379 [Amblyomma americanum]|uniref:Evasin n=1 Tax=Amblyomma americanum TaxID=6943 RepID=A0AAQ4EH23_AMBAM